MLKFDQEIRCLDDFSLRGSLEEGNLCLWIKDQELVEEIDEFKQVSLGLLKQDYLLLQSAECPFLGYEVYCGAKLIGTVSGYSDSSQLPILDINMNGKSLLLPVVDEYLEFIGDDFLRVKNIEDLRNL